MTKKPKMRLVIEETILFCFYHLESCSKPVFCKLFSLQDYVTFSGFLCSTFSSNFGEACLTMYSSAAQLYFVPC
jgi:hypothetical protein